MGRRCSCDNGVLLSHHRCVILLEMQRTVIQTAIPYPLIWREGELVVRLGNELFSVQFHRQYGRPPGQESGVPSAIASNNVELRYDRLARVAHTALQILLPTYVEDHRELVAIIHRLVNRIIEVYRLATGEFYLDTIPKHELWPYLTRTVDEEGMLSPEITYSKDFGYGVTLARFASVPDDARQLLLSGSEVPIPSILFLNARREELFENFRLAVVEAETAFETLVENIVARYYRKAGLSEPDIDAKLNAGLKNLLKDHIPSCCGEVFVGTQEHTDWETDLYDLRNAVVHSGASADADKAARALAAAERALDWLSKRMPV